MTRRCGQLVNNLGQIVPALGGAPGSQDSAVSLFSVCSCLGRLFTGILSQHLQSVHNIHRTTFFLAGSVCMLGAMLALASAQLWAVTLATLLGGLSFGMHNTLCPVIVADLFGMPHYSENAALVNTSACKHDRLPAPLHQRRCCCRSHASPRRHPPSSLPRSCSRHSMTRPPVPRWRACRLRRRGAGRGVSASGVGVWLGSG